MLFLMTLGGQVQYDMFILCDKVMSLNFKSFFTTYIFSHHNLHTFSSIQTCTYFIGINSYPLKKYSFPLGEFSILIFTHSLAITQ
jgi:hypothetical protein